MAIDSAIEAGVPLVLVNLIRLPPYATTLCLLAGPSTRRCRTRRTWMRSAPPRTGRPSSESRPSSCAFARNARCRRCSRWPPERDAGLLVFGPHLGRVGRMRFRRVAKRIRERGELPRLGRARRLALGGPPQHEQRAAHRARPRRRDGHLTLTRRVLRSARRAGFESRSTTLRVSPPQIEPNPAKADGPAGRRSARLRSPSPPARRGTSRSSPGMPSERGAPGRRCIAASARRGPPRRRDRASRVGVVASAEARAGMCPGSLRLRGRRPA